MKAPEMAVAMQEFSKEMTKVCLQYSISPVIVNYWSWKIAVCSNFATLQCYSAASWQHFILNIENNSDLFKFRYAIAPQFENIDFSYFLPFP